jgi:hypothetical protein
MGAEQTRAPLRYDAPRTPATERSKNSNSATNNKKNRTIHRTNNCIHCLLPNVCLSWSMPTLPQLRPSCLLRPEPHSGGQGEGRKNTGRVQRMHLSTLSSFLSFVCLPGTCCEGWRRTNGTACLRNLAPFFLGAPPVRSQQTRRTIHEQTVGVFRCADGDGGGCTRTDVVLKFAAGLTSSGQRLRREREREREPY